MFSTNRKFHRHHKTLITFNTFTTLLKLGFLILSNKNIITRYKLYRIIPTLPQDKFKYPLNRKVGKLFKRILLLETASSFPATSNHQAISSIYFTHRILQYTFLQANRTHSRLQRSKSQGFALYHKKRKDEKRIINYNAYCGKNFHPLLTAFFSLAPRYLAW